MGKNNKKAKKIKADSFKTEEQKEIIRFIKILLIVLLFIFVVYFVTSFFVKKDLTSTKEKTAVTEISYSKMIFGTMLNRPYKEYYVLAYSSEDNKANYYGSLGDKYSNKTESLNLYYIDLADTMNKDYIAHDGKSNTDAKELADLKVGRITLIKISDGKIVKYFENITDIKNELNIK